jgi:hypothetical protein
MCVLKRAQQAGVEFFQNRRFGHFSEFSDFRFSVTTRIFTRVPKNVSLLKYHRFYTRNELYLCVPKKPEKPPFPDFGDSGDVEDIFRIFSKNTDFDQFYTNFNDVYTAAERFYKTQKFSVPDHFLKFRKFGKKVFPIGNFPTFSKLLLFRKFRDFQEFRGFSRILLHFMGCHCIIIGKSLSRK